VPWFWVDDKLHDHHKARRAGVEAMGLWVLAGSWCAEQRAADADGFVPADVAYRWGGRKTDALAERLVDAGLWEPATVRGEDGWRFHDWTGDDGVGWQKSLETVESERTAARERMRRLRAGRKGGGGGSGKPPGSTEQPPKDIPPPDDGSPDVRANTGRTFGVSDAAVTQPQSVSLTLDYLLTLVCRRLSGGTRETTTDAERSAWAEWVGGADLETELRSWLIYNADTDLRNPSGSLRGWLELAAKRAAQAPPGCRDCRDGWMGEDEQGRPVPCPSCRPNVVPLRAAGGAS
jgi:hypothetical protein